ncbi:hypothetical protein ECZU51_47480 [Escherichia coli]|nr:hypothetical protein ECZU51_47480 [Escherichia coli]
MKNDVISPEFDENGRPLRRIRSFVRRRATDQRREHALENYWPVMGVEFSEDMLDFPALFGREAPVTLEIGFGMGRRWWQWLKIAPSRTSSALKCIHRALVRAWLLRMKRA